MSAVEEEQYFKPGFFVHCEGHRVLDGYGDSELLFELSNQGPLGRFAVVDLAAGKFPQSAHMLVLGPETQQDASVIVTDDCGNDG